MSVINMDCRLGMSTLPANSFDAIVTDPPYGLSKQPNMREVLKHWLAGDDYTHTGEGFMGKSWDSFVPGPLTWEQAYRVLKPGGYCAVFAGSRTVDLMATSLRLAGFEVVDMLHWLYGSGFPKSMDISKAIDKCNGEPNRLHKFTAWMRSTGLTSSDLNRITNTNMGGHYTTAASQPAIPTPEIWTLIRPHCLDVPLWVDELVDRIAAEREVIGEKSSGLSHGSGTTVGKFTDSRNENGLVNITAPATDAAKQWDGWGTALKPCHEPIILCRKPLDGTYASNVLTHGCGALNIDGCRNGDRWPGNVLHDGCLPEPMDRYFYCAKASKADRNSGLDDFETHSAGEMTGGRAEGSAGLNSPRSGAGRTSGSKNVHPTVKPTDLMRWLCRLVTPPGGTILDPFTGSGSTGRGSVLEGFNFVGFELSAEYAAIAQARIEHAKSIRNDL